MSIERKKARHNTRPPKIFIFVYVAVDPTYSIQSERPAAY